MTRQLRAEAPVIPTCAALSCKTYTRHCEKDVKYFRWLGAMGVVSRDDTLAVLDEVTKALAPMQFKPRAAKAGSAEARPWRTAS